LLKDELTLVTENKPLKVPPCVFDALRVEKPEKVADSKGPETPSDGILPEIVRKPPGS
jgi:hypothetical protein